MRKLTESMTKWPWILLIFALLCGGAFVFLFFNYRIWCWIPVAVLALGLLAMVLTWHFLIRGKLQQSMVALGLEMDEELAARISGLDLPYAVVNRAGKLLWKNGAFEEMLEEYGSEAQKRTPLLQEIFPQISLYPETGYGKKESEPRYVKLGERVFELRQRQAPGKGGLTALLLSDETEHIRTRETLERERGVAGLLYVDNYEELLKQTDSGRHSLLGALIEQQIQQYFRERGGIVCKTERDRFSLFMNHEGLARCKNDRFHLLEQVKEIKTDGNMSVTVSIAFGEDGESYHNNLALAQAAMDLALGRGGDQAVVKGPEALEYFGGKAQGEATKTRVRARVKAQALRELMALHNPVFIMGHTRGDNDSFGAAVGIYRAAVSLSRQAHIVLDSVSYTVRPFWERFQASAEYPRDMFLSGEEALARIQEGALVVVVDTNQRSMVECPALLEKTDQVVVFDHHRQGDGAISALLSYVEPYASSASEMITEILQYFEDGITPRPLEAEAMYSGIVIDTNSFTDRTSSRTFEAAAFLRRSGADLVQVKKMLREDYREYRAKAECMSSVQVDENGFAYGVCPAEGLDSPTIVGSQVANDLLNVSTVRASFVFTPLEDMIYVSARAIDEVNVQLIMERLGGGGHLGAAGTQMKDVTVSQAMDRVRTAILEMKKEGAL